MNMFSPIEKYCFDSFMTGSRVYGTPTTDSDVDICMLMSISAAMHLAGMAGKDVGEEYEGCAIVMRFGMMNIIAHTDEASFRAWKKATNDLIFYRPVSRAVAVATIKAELLEAGLEC